ncbi:ATP-dependent helicase [Patescibacteria group bacterium]|nr:ATP-dependent helicase [Patescibacteria group bacterium]MBU1473108.1 ATP-dependent helicase [Patescibacteria group bacterium]MBU2544453.1 ATP-dependent helicase [Patescibacteria group bacterium]
MIKTPVDRRVLNVEQKQAVEHGEGPLLIIAGAGTGKTTVVTERIKHIISSGRALPQEILALTFTEKAAREMEERIDIALPYGVTQMWISTFHAFCDRVLRAEAINIGLDPAYHLMTEAETILFFRKNLFKFSLKYFRPLGNPTKFIGGVLQHFNRLKDEDVAPSQYIDWVMSKVKCQKSKVKDQNQTEDKVEELEKYQELAVAYRTYEELKEKEGVADYADLISNTLKLFRTRPKILQRYQEQFTYILIDEFQDTNISQNELSMLLAGKKQNITVVGDDDQAIYRWRGAAISNIIQFRKRFKKAKVVVLTKNYRSTQEILNRSYDLIQHNNPDRLEAVEHIEKKLKNMRGIQGVSIQFIHQDRVENEAEEVAKQVKSLKSKVKSDGTEYEWKDFAILVRANNHAEPFVRALSRAGIPYQFLGPGQLLRKPEVKDLIAYLKVLYNFEDNVAMYRVLTMDWAGVSARDVAALLNFSRKYGMSLFEACEQSELENVKKLIAMVHRHLGLIKKDTAGQILYYFLQESGLLRQFTSYKTTKEERVATNIARFFDKLKTYETDHDDASVFTVVDWIDMSMELGESPLAADLDWTENNAVNILTVHSSKGLEFPVVFLANLVSARFPTIERREQIPIPEALIKEILPQGDYHLEEERRLFYVGMTRARDLLYFSAANYYGEGKREKKLSPFIAEALGEAFVSRLASTPTAKQLHLSDWEKIDEKEELSKSPVVIDRLSYSQLETFITCPLQYKYRYILRIPVPPSAALSFGSTMHQTVRAFYELVKQGQKPKKKELLELYDKYWSSIGFRDKTYEAKVRRHGKELLSEFYHKGYDPSVTPLGLEQSFTIKITPALKLVGKIDRIDPLSGDNIEIIDYKTGQATKSRNAGSDMQLTVYAMAASEKGVYDKPPEHVVVSFYFFEGQEKISSSRTKKQLDDARLAIEKTAVEIGKSDFRPTPGKFCDFCEFRLICEAWK